MYKLIIEDDERQDDGSPIIRDEITVGRKEGNTIRLTGTTSHGVMRGSPARVMGSSSKTLLSYNGIKVSGDRIREGCCWRRMTEFKSATIRSRSSSTKARPRSKYPVKARRRRPVNHAEPTLMSGTPAIPALAQRPCAAGSNPSRQGSRKAGTARSFRQTLHVRNSSSKSHGSDRSHRRQRRGAESPLDLVITPRSFAKVTSSRSWTCRAPTACVSMARNTANRAAQRRQSRSRPRSSGVHPAGTGHPEGTDRRNDRRSRPAGNAGGADHPDACASGCRRWWCVLVLDPAAEGRCRRRGCQDLIDVESDLAAKRWQDVLDKTGKIIGNNAIAIRTRDAATAKRTVAEKESKNKQIYDRFAGQRGSGNYDAALKTYREIPKDSVYQRARRKTTTKSSRCSSRAISKRIGCACSRQLWRSAVAGADGA